MTNDHGTVNSGGLQPGDRIGKYEVRELLGAGGQSIVYKAYDDLLDRFVAIKQVSPHLAVNPDYLAKMRENLRKIAHLGQRNDAIVTIHDVLDDERGVFYVMEFVEGHTLEKLIAESSGPLEPKAALLILFRLAAALHDVHGEGIVHRDIKPSNIILTEGLRPKIIDFGVAAFGNQDASMPLATTKYLAPELYSRPDADARADLYSLGFILYELLLGRPKFNEIFEDVVRDPHSAALRWMKWHGNESVQAPPLHQVNPAVPQALSDIISKLIEKDPQKRFADAEELGRAVKMQFSSKFRRTGAGEMHHDAAEDLHIPPMKGHAPAISQPPSPFPTTAGAAPAAPGAVEESPDLEGPATAPLPREPMSPAKRMAILAVAGVIFLGFVGAGVMWLLDVREKSRARALSAVQMYNKAAGLYEEGNYSQALEGFTALRQKHSGTTPATKAEVLAAMCRAQIAIEQKRFSEAQIQEEHATQAAEALQERSENSALVDWTRGALQQIEQIGRSRLSTNIYWDAMENTRLRLDQARKATDYDEILRWFNQQLGASGVGLTPRQETQVADMQRQIARRKFLFLVDQQVREGDALMNRKEYDAAQAAYTRAEDRVRDEKVLQTIPPEQRDSLLRQIDTKTQDLAARRKADRTYQAIRVAEKAKDYPAMIKALQEALQLPTISAEDKKIYQEKLRTIEASQAVTNAKVLFENKQYTKALAEVDKVLKLQPKHIGAQTLKANIETAKKRQEAIQSGDQAVAKENFTEALNYYRQADSLGSEKDIKAKITESEYQLYLRRADALAREGQYDKAQVAYAEAKRVKPAAKAHVETRIMLMQTQRKYGEFLVKGDDALKRKRWQEAIRWYKQAKQQTQQPKEVDARISETYYQKFFTGGKRALEEENMPVARWNFKQALRYKDTPEARELLGKAGGETNEK